MKKLEKPKIPRVLENKRINDLESEDKVEGVSFENETLEKELSDVEFMVVRLKILILINHYLRMLILLIVCLIPTIYLE